MLEIFSKVYALGDGESNVAHLAIIEHTNASDIRSIFTPVRQAEELLELVWSMCCSDSCERPDLFEVVEFLDQLLNRDES
jgi:hypothetical protein